MYKFFALLAYFLIFAAFFPIASSLQGSSNLFFSEMPYSLYFEYRWHLVAGGVILGLASWLGARKRIDNIVTHYKPYTRANFSKMKKELLNREIKDEQKLNHPAMRTSWAPIFQPTLSKKGWQKIPSNVAFGLKIKKNKNGILYLVPSMSRSVFNIFLIGLGVLLLTNHFWGEKTGSVFMMYLIGISLIIVGIGLFKFHKHFYFDKKRNEFVEVENTFLKKKLLGDKKILALDDISGLQIIRQYSKDSRGVWELNIIKKDAQRYKIMSHKSRVFITESAITISKFLNVPVWEEIGAHFGLLQEKTIVVPTWDSILDFFLRKKRV